MSADPRALENPVPLNKLTAAKAIAPAGGNTLPYAKAGSLFVIEEYKRLCAEVDLYLKESANCVNYSVAATAAFWSWLTANSIWQQRPAVLFVPAILGLFWWLRWQSFQKTMGVIGNYLQETEKLFCSNHGWETWLRTPKIYPLRSPGSWAGFYFGTLFCGNLGTAIAFILFGSPKAMDTAPGDALAKAIEQLVKALLEGR